MKTNAIAQVLGASQVVTFGYNATDQLTGETSDEANPFTKLTRTYDPMGNWLTRTDQGRDTATTGIRNISQTFTPNRLNQLTGIATSYTDGTTGTQTISYDSRGNVKQSRDSKSASYLQYQFDDQNRLFKMLTRRSIDNVVVGETMFVYDGMGRKKRVREMDVVNGSYLTKRNTYFGYDGMDVVRERDENWGTAGDATTRSVANYQLTRVGNIGGILARTKQVSGQTDRHSFYSYDGTGNVLSITDASQNVQCAYGYSGFGLEKVQEASGWGQPYRYSTKWQHPNSGLVEYGFRFYNPSWGRWINRDPIGEAGGSNLYGMVGNNPVDTVDPYGLSPFDDGPSDFGGGESGGGGGSVDWGMYVYRSMKKGPNGFPEKGPTARTLGARPGTDVTVTVEKGIPMVGPGSGISVAGKPKNLPPHRKPPRYGGDCKDPLWRIDVSTLPDGLIFVPDNPKNTDLHGEIQPSRRMPLERYQHLLGQTQPNWELAP